LKKKKTLRPKNPPRGKKKKPNQGDSGIQGHFILYRLFGGGVGVWGFFWGGSPILATGLFSSSHGSVSRENLNKEEKDNPLFTAD